MINLVMTYTSEIFIEQFNVTMYYFQRQQFIIVLFNGTAKVQTGISETIESI